MHRSITKTIFTGVGLNINVETTGYDGGNGSLTTLSIRPRPDFTHSVEIFSLQSMHYEREGTISTEEVASLSFQVHGDMELNGLRLMLKAATQALDEMLGEAPEDIGVIY